RQGIHASQGQARQKPASLKLGFGSDTYSYSVDLGLPKGEQKLHSRGRLCHTCIERCWFLVLFALSARCCQLRRRSDQIRTSHVGQARHDKECRRIESIEGFENRVAQPPSAVQICAFRSSAGMTMERKKI